MAYEDLIKIDGDLNMPKGSTESTKSGKSSSTGKANSAFMKPLQPSAELAAVVGSSPLPRSEVVSLLWEYIRKHDLQNPQNKREILADAILERVFGKKKVTMFEMNKLISGHLK